MKITEIKLLTLESDREQNVGGWQLMPIPNLRDIRITHGRKPGSEKRKVSAQFLRVKTDEGIDSVVSVDLRPFGPDQVDILRSVMVGENPLRREELWQKLYKGTRWVYQVPGWFGPFDNALWDICGKAAGVPVYALIGRVRERIQIYQTGGNMPLEKYIDHVDSVRDCGVTAYKLHSYKGGKADIPILEKLREAVGDDYALMHDPVCSYDLRESIEVARVMESLGYIWLEEPFHEQKMNVYQQLCDAVEIPILATEMLMNDLGITTQWMLHGATDMCRGNARHGATMVLKMAHFAELHGKNVELNGHGGLFGLVHAHLECCIENTQYFESNGAFAGRDGHRDAGLEWGLLNAPQTIDGHKAPPDGPGWGAEWDEEKFNAMIVAEH